MNNVTNYIRSLFGFHPVTNSAPYSDPWISARTVRKMYAVFLGYLATSAGVLSASPEGCDNPESCELPESYELEERATLVRETFPPWYERMFHPGLLSNSEGNRYCSIQESVPKLSDCEWFSEESEKAAASGMPEQYKELMADPTIFAEKGAFAQPLSDYGTGISRIHFGANPQKLKNHRAVTKYLEKNLLQNPQFFDQSAEEIVKVIKTTHRMMVKGLPDPDGNLTPGEFRTQHMFVTGDRKNDSLETFHKIMRENGATEKDIGAFERSRAKVQRYGSLGAAHEHFTSQEKRAWMFLGHIPPDPEEIEEKMLAFAKELKIIGPNVTNGKKDVVEAAAWVHQELGSIHPFVDGNGRVARPWMNGILQLGGKKAVVIPSDEEYTAAIVKDQKKKGKFSDYLRWVISWNEKQEELN